MKKVSKNARWRGGAASGIPGVPVVVDRTTFQAELDALRVQEYSRALTQANCRRGRWAGKTRNAGSAP